MHTSKNSDKIVVFTGAGISAPSGLATFRDPGGIWSRYRIEEVATPDAWAANPAKVLEFYNLRRAQLAEVAPNDGHWAVAALEEKYDVSVITQNVDNLHERAGSSRVIHLHGELNKARSTVDASLLYEIGSGQLNLGDLCEKGGQLRPHVVWFGEEILSADEALAYLRDCDILIVAGTSLTVYPAAAMIQDAPAHAERYLVDPRPVTPPQGFTLLNGSADKVLPDLTQKLLNRV